MITRLEVDGFKSLRGFAIDLEPFTVLIGPNGAGKSNVLEAIALASRLHGRAPEDALKGGRGRASDQFSRHKSEAVREMALSLEMLEPERVDDEYAQGILALRKRYELNLSVKDVRGIEKIKLEHHSRDVPNEGDRWLALHPEWARLAESPATDNDFDKFFPGQPYVNLVELDGMNLREASDRIDSGKLAADGSNLPSVLASLSDDLLGEVRAELAGLVPGVANFEVVESDEVYRIEFHMRDGDVVPARLISSGTLRVLALLTAVHGQRSWSSVLCLEEPENGIYPGRLRRLIALLREVTDARSWREGESEYPPPQVIVTTHSPVFLAALAEHPEHLRYIDTVQRKGIRVTRARTVGERASPREGQSVASLAEIKAILESASASEEDR